ncbi:MAG: DMT family transporter [Bryobacteraceae bacterium]
MQIWFLLACVALILFGISGITQKLSTNNFSFELSFVWFTVAFAAISGTILATTRLDWNVTPAVVALAALGGLLNGLGALTSFAAFEKGGKAAIVVPIINLYPLVTVIGAWVFFGERLTLVQTLGILCALGAVYLLAQERQPEPDKMEAS